eukprot:COSAG02_NODE_69222_length_199_cov_89.800000_1_plen_66_part_11
MKMRALQQKAADMGIAEDKIDEADDKADLIELMLATAAAEEDASGAAEAKAARLAQLKEELSGLKM